MVTAGCSPPKFDDYETVGIAFVTAEPGISTPKDSLLSLRSLDWDGNTTEWVATPCTSPENIRQFFARRKRMARVTDSPGCIDLPQKRLRFQAVAYCDWSGQITQKRSVCDPPFEKDKNRAPLVPKYPGKPPSHRRTVGGLAYHEGKRYASHPLQAPETPRNNPQHQTTPPPRPPRYSVPALAAGVRNL